MKTIKKTAKKRESFLNLKKLFSIPNILIVLVFGFLLRVILSPFGTLTLDQNTFIAWSMRLASVGIPKFYFGTWSDYLPGYLYLLYILGLINKLNIIPFNLLYKLPGILSDIGASYLIYKIVFRLKNEKWALISASLYLFNPAVFANSALWGQVDGLTALFSLLTIYFLEFSLSLSAASLAIGTLIKPQMGIVSLIILFLMIREKWDFKKIAIYIVSSFLIFIAGFMPFSNGTNLLNFIVSRLNVSLNQYPYTSINAFNFWAIFGTWKPDTGLSIIGGVIVIILFFAFGLKLLKQKGGEYILLAFTFASTFLFMTRMHERHLLPIFAPLSIAVALSPVFIFALIGFSFVYIANLYWAWNWVSNNFADAFGEGLIKILSIINVLLVLIFIPSKKFLEEKLSRIYHFFSKGNKRNNAEASYKFVFPEVKLSKKSIKTLFAVVVVFALLTRFYNLGSPSTHYFDEVYHAFTAQNMLHGNTKAWEWWNPNPDGFAYEWTHPPLAKEGMVLGMLFLGDNSLGWRFPGALLGVGSVILVYFIAKEIFDDELTGLIASAVFSLDGLALVLSRIGMNDSYMLFFALSSVFAYLKKKNLLAAIFLGFALASKWSALWVIPIIFVAHFVFKRKLKWSYIFFFLIPPIIYISTYFPLFTNKQIQSEYVANTFYNVRVDNLSIGNPIGKTGIIALDMFIDTQKQMWWYHTRLKATHPYSSLWYTWPILVRPIYLYTSPELNGQVARIYAMGNPIVFWGGTLAIAGVSLFAIRDRNKKLGFIIFSYLVFFTPWAISPRIMFLYHYLPSIPFMAIAIAYLLRRFKEWIIPFLILSLVVFVYFYPHWAGLTIPLQLDASYYWLPSWR